MVAADRSSHWVWERELPSNQEAGRQPCRSLVVVHRDGSDTLVGCIYGQRIMIDN